MDLTNTARTYGLRINSYVDERLDVEKAADAAARYLLDSYNIFGDWCLAISAYNCGAGNVNKAIRRAGGNKDFWSIYPYLPKETRGYMPAFVGAHLAVEGFVVTMFDGRTRVHTQVVNQLREHFQDMVFNTIIQRNIRLSEAPSHGKPIVLYDIMSNGSSNYLKLAREVMERNEPQAQTL